MSRFTRCALLLLIVLGAALPTATPAATPDHDTLAPDANGKGSKSWTGQVTLGGDAAGDSDGCFGTDKKPDPTSGCDFYKLTVTVPSGFYDGFLGGVQVTLDGFGQADLDLGIYRLNPDHLIAGSKMYENLPHYLFKIGTYESFDGGRTWKDLGQLPGYCGTPAQCDPTNETEYRTVSDVSMAFDDEGNAYAQVLDAPGGTAGFTGFNMTIHIKKPGEAQLGPPLTVHDNRNNPITEQLLLDDKNWLAIDNHTTPDGSPNQPKDGKIGT